MGRHVAPLELWRMYLRVSIYIMLLRSIVKSAIYAIYETLIQILAPEEQHVNRSRI